jgi:hypothetical protein
MAHGDAREGKWRGNWRMEWVASTLHTTWKHGVSSITAADAHTSATSIRLNWRPRRFKWTRPFRHKTKSGFCACAITFQLVSTERVSRANTNVFVKNADRFAVEWNLYYGIHRRSQIMTQITGYKIDLNMNCFLIPRHWLPEWWRFCCERGGSVEDVIITRGCW